MTFFAKRFKQERLKKGLTQEELAKIFNTSKSNISRYENGNSLPGVITLEQYADFFDVSIDYLIGRINSPYFHKLSEELQNLLKEQNLKYLKLAHYIKNKNISTRTVEIFIKFYEKIKSEFED